MEEVGGAKGLDFETCKLSGKRTGIRHGQSPAQKNYSCCTAMHPHSSSKHAMHDCISPPPPPEKHRPAKDRHMP